MFVIQLLVRTSLRVAVYALLLFLPAWTLNWWRGWVLIGLVFVGMIVTRLWVFRDNEALLAERRQSPLQQGQPLADKLLVIAFVVVFPAYIAFIPLDVFRFHFFAKPAAMISLLGLVVVVGGWFLISLAFRENAFAAAIVKHQTDRQQKVVDTGVYSVVRHPLYAGVACIILGIAFWLQSYAAAIVSIVPLIVLVMRILVEENFLGTRLDGYNAYSARVRNRIIPLVW